MPHNPLRKNHRLLQLPYCKSLNIHDAYQATTIVDYYIVREYLPNTCQFHVVLSME